MVQRDLQTSRVYMYSSTQTLKLDKTQHEHVPKIIQISHCSGRSRMGEQSNWKHTAIVLHHSLSIVVHFLLLFNHSSSTYVVCHCKFSIIVLCLLFLVSCHCPLSFNYYSLYAIAIWPSLSTVSHMRATQSKVKMPNSQEIHFSFTRVAGSPNLNLQGNSHLVWSQLESSLSIETQFIIIWLQSKDPKTLRAHCHQQLDSPDRLTLSRR